MNPIMAAEAGPQTAAARIRAMLRRFRGRLALRIVALTLSVYFGWHGYRIVSDDKFQLGHALLWDLLALAFIGAFAWDGSLPNITHWPSAVRAYVRAHPVELGVLAAIACIGVFVRLFRYGDLPPSGYLYLEEHINGGVAWTILHGDRPYAYPLVRYSTALGLWLFGPTTFGMRAPLIAAGIVSIAPFYLLMREVVDRPAALFATAMFASLRIFADTSVYFQVPTLAVIVMVWTMLRGFRTGNPLWLVPAATLAAVMSYEYEAFKAVPILAAAYIAFVIVRALLWPFPVSLRSWLARTRELMPRAIVAAVVIVVAFLIATGPLLAARHRGQDIYFSSLNRQEGDRQARGTPGLFSPDAGKQMKWAVQVFTPSVKPGYPVIGPVETRGVIDQMTSILIWASLAAAALMFWRGARALFVSWFVGGLLFSGLLLSNFAAWKVAGFTAPAIVLIGFLADDAFRIFKRYGRAVVAIACATMAVVVALVLFLNLRVMNANANDERLLREWSNTPSQLYGICDHLRGLPPDDYAFVAQKARSGWGFSSPPKDDAERIAAWGDYKFVCWGLRGQQVSDLQEAWPSFVDGDGPISVLAMANPDEMSIEVSSIEKAMPELGKPTFTKTAPGRAFQIVSFDTVGAVINARRGLNVVAASAGESAAAPTIVPGPSFALPAVPAGGSVTLSGLVFLPYAMNGSLRPAGSIPSRISITVDGSLGYDGTGAAAREVPQQLMPGWHIVEISVRAPSPSSSTIAFEWHGPDGTVTTTEDDFFALAEDSVWKHVRTLAGTSSGEALRYDFAPHLSSFDGLRLDARHPLPSGTTVTDEDWSARWTVENTGVYRMSIFSPGQTATLRIDGRVITTKQQTSNEAVIDVPLSAGDHRVELTFRAGRDPYIGGLLHVTDQGGNEVTFAVHPF